MREKKIRLSAHLDDPGDERVGLDVRKNERASVEMGNGNRSSMMCDAYARTKRDRVGNDRSGIYPGQSDGGG